MCVCVQMKLQCWRSFVSNFAYETVHMSFLKMQVYLLAVVETEQTKEIFFCVYVMVVIF